MYLGVYVVRSNYIHQITTFAPYFVSVYTFVRRLSRKFAYTYSSHATFKLLQKSAKSRYTVQIIRLYNRLLSLYLYN